MIHHVSRENQTGQMPVTSDTKGQQSPGAGGEPLEAGGDKSLPFHDVVIVDRICREFEKVWHEDSWRTISDLLNSVEPHVRRHLFRELVAGDWCFRKTAGQSPDMEFYRREFSDLADELTAPFFEDLIETEGQVDAERTASLPERFDGFHIVREIGRGGMGIVYAARQESLNRLVAIKVLPATMVWREKMLKRFQREAEATAKLRHPHIVPVFGVGQYEGVHYYVMDLIEGRSLALRTEHDENDRRLGSESQATVVARIGQQIAGALQYAHEQGIVHRDVKPSNLMVEETGHVWLTDFGLAGFVEDDSDLTETGELNGTLRYLPPEAFQGQSDVRSDVYGLGLTLYELLTSRPAFDTENRRQLLDEVLNEDPPGPRQLNPRVPRDLETVILKSIAKEPQRRYQTAGEMAADLGRFLEYRPIRARRVSPPEHAWRWARRRPAQASLVTAVAMAVVMAVSFGFWLQRERATRLRAVTNQAFELLGQVERRRQASRQEESLGNQDTPTASFDARGLNTLNVDIKSLQDSIATVTLAAEMLKEHQIGGDIKTRVDEQLRQLQHQLARGQLFGKLHEIRLESLKLHATARVVRVAQEDVSPMYREFFSQLGISSEDMPPQEASDVIRQFDQVMKYELLIALNHWFHCNVQSQQNVSWLEAVLDKADEDGTRRQIRQTWQRRDLSEFHRLDLLATDVDSRIVCDLSLRVNGLIDIRKWFVDATLQSRPVDFWVHHAVALLSMQRLPFRFDDAFHAAAVADSVYSTPLSRQHLGFALMADGQFEKAEAVFRPLLEQRPADPHLRDALAQLVFARGDKEGACKLMAEATRLLPETRGPVGKLENPGWMRERRLAEFNSRIVARYGEYLFACGQTAEAERVLRRAIVNLDIRRSGSVPLSKLLISQDRTEEAVKLLEEMVSLEEVTLSPPGRAEVFEALYEAYGHAGRTADQQAIKPTLVESILRYAPMLSSTNRRKRELYERVLELAPDDPEALSGLTSLTEESARNASGG